jgi:hypothetical protein
MEGEIGESPPVLGERKPDILPVSPNPDNDLLSGPVASTSLVRNGSRKALLDADPGLARAYAVAQRVRRAIRPVMTVEVTSTCNLYCEGCFYFHDDFEPQAESEDVGDWRSFFEDQYSMGRRYAVFHGAEPALKQKRLLAAAESFRRGIVYTNGTIRIDDDIPFIRCVSIWGSEETTGMIRGGSVYHKALRNFENDPKARFSVVISAQNYRDLPRIIADLHAAGVSATISYFSPSHSYMTKLRSSAPNDSEFFRFSNEDENMLMSSEEFAIVNDMIADLSSRYPQTVRQGPIFNQWLTSAGPRYTLDSHGMANECAVRPRDIHELYGTNLEPIRGKCALPDNDCSQCRITPVSTTSILHNAKAYSSSREAISFWIESAFQAGQVFIRDDDRDVWGDAPPPMNGWQEHFGVASS